MEIWKDMVGFEGLYEVSNKGRIRNVEMDIVGGNGAIRHLNSQILSLQNKPCAGKKDRYQVNLIKDGKKYMKLVSRIVAEAFIPNPNNYPQVNHIDECPSNNCVENLEWCTAKYNNNYGTRIQRSNEAKYKAVNMYDLDGNYIQSFKSIKEAAKAICGDCSCVTKVCKGKYKCHKGYVFKYA